jgi:hypothetical protein
VAEAVDRDWMRIAPPQRAAGSNKTRLGNAPPGNFGPFS